MPARAGRSSSPPRSSAVARTRALLDQRRDARTTPRCSPRTPARGLRASVPSARVWTIADVPPADQALATRRSVSVVEHRRPPPERRPARDLVWQRRRYERRRRAAARSTTRSSGFVELADSRPHDLSVRLGELDTLLLLVGDLVELRASVAAAERRASDLALILDADIEAQSRTAGSEQVLRVVARRLADLCRAPIVDISSVERDRLHTVVSWDREAFDHAVEGVEYDLDAWPVTKAAVQGARAEIARDLRDPRLDSPAIAEMQAWGVAVDARPASRGARLRDRGRRGLRQRAARLRRRRRRGDLPGRSREPHPRPVAPGRGPGVPQPRRCRSSSSSARR